MPVGPRTPGPRPRDAGEPLRTVPPVGKPQLSSEGLQGFCFSLVHWMHAKFCPFKNLEFSHDSSGAGWTDRVPGAGSGHQALPREAKRYMVQQGPWKTETVIALLENHQVLGEMMGADRTPKVEAPPKEKQKPTAARAPT